MEVIGSVVNDNEDGGASEYQQGSDTASAFYNYIHGSVQISRPKPHRKLLIIILYEVIIMANDSI